jgi:hypothetical protein
VLLFSVFLSWPSFAQQEEDKYNFSELEQVEEFRKTRVQGIEVLDPRAVLLDLGRNHSYLLILRRNLHGLVFANRVDVSSTNNQVRAGVDFITAHDHRTASGLIEKIYRLDDSEERRRVRFRLLRYAL